MKTLVEAIKKFDYYQLLTYFFFFAFLGWIFETTTVLINFHKFTYRGFFFAYRSVHYYFPMVPSGSAIGQLRLIWGLPIIDMYGYGAVIIVYVLGHLKKQPIKLFFSGMALMTVFELFGSYFCTTFLKHAYWNYSQEYMNFEGRICLQSTVAWGLLSVIAVLWLQPKVARIYSKVQKKAHFRGILLLLFGYFLFCTVTKYFIDPQIIPN